MTAEDKTKLRRYFTARESFATISGLLRNSAGGSSVTVDLNRDKRNVGIGFECPRQSLMTSIEHELFDDLLIGNYMRTTLHNVERPLSAFHPLRGKICRQWRGKIKREVVSYFGHYYMRDPIAHTLKRFSTASETDAAQGAAGGD